MDILSWGEAAIDNGIKEGLMPEQPKIAEELSKMEYEPLLPVEKKLIGWSIGIGVVLLGILVWTSYTFFPGGH